MTTNHDTLLRSRSGFTLVEVMITLVVIAIVAALASPAFLAMAPEMQLRGAAQDLYSAVQDAKIRAVKENTPVIVEFNVNSYCYYSDLDRDGSYTASTVDTFTDINGDGKYNPGEPFVDGDGDNVYSGEIAYATNFNDYDYGITPGTGLAPDNWKGDPLAAPITETEFRSNGIPSTSGVFYIQNKTADTCYALTITPAGGIKLRKYDGADPTDPGYGDVTDHWKW